MGFLKELSSMTFVAATMFCCTSLAAFSQEQSAEVSEPDVVFESFEGEDQSLMLGGQVHFNPSKSDWVVYVSDGDLVMENRKNPQSLHYNDIEWVKFPDADSVETTQDLIVSAVVESENEGRGGVGILVGSGKSGNYLAFTVDGQGRFHVLKKDGRQLRAMHSAKHEAVLTDAPNKLSFQVRGPQVLFFSNGTKLIQIPFSKRTNNSRNPDGVTGIGLAAFGTGTYRFEEIEISRPN